MTTTPSPYTGRIVDVSIFHGAKSSGDVLLTQYLANEEGGEVCTGVAKVMQRFVALLLTVAGSMPLKPGQGCAFLSDLLQGKVQTQGDLFAAFAFAAGSIGRQFRITETAADPADEKFQNAELVTATLSPGRVVLRINLTTVAGSSRVAILPIKTIA